MRRITIEDVPLTLDFDRWTNSYEVRNNKGFLVEALRNDYDAAKYLIDTLCISKETAERIVQCTFLAGLRR